MAQKASVLGGGAFGLKADRSIDGEVGGDVPIATVVVPAPQFGPVVGSKVFLCQVAPRDIVTAIIGGQVDAVGLVVRGDDDAAHVGHAVFTQILLVDTQHIGRCGSDRLHVVVEGEAIDVAEVTRLVDAQDDGLQEAVEAAEHLHR